jgi:nucleoside-diphosphate-sugar epimerase
MNEFWRGKIVLVTGAGGFIGSHLVERLVVEGA